MEVIYSRKYPKRYYAEMSQKEYIDTICEPLPRLKEYNLCDWFHTDEYIFTPLFDDVSVLELMVHNACMFARSRQANIELRKRTGRLDIVLAFDESVWLKELKGLMLMCDDIEFCESEGDRGAAIVLRINTHKCSIRYETISLSNIFEDE